MKINIRETLTRYKRVLLVARKPDVEELKETTQRDERSKKITSS